MKRYLYPFYLPITICFLLMAQLLFAQDSLDLLKKLDKGLPASGLNGSQLGEVVVCIGDVNKDGYDDWAVALPNAADYETGEIIGKIYVYLGSSFIQNEKAPDLIIARKGYGNHIASAGDINNDGYADFLISSSDYIEIYYGGNTLHSQQDVIIKETNATGPFKESVTSAGDVNNDGFDDLLVPSSNGVSIFFGGTPMDTQPDLFLKKKQERDWFGSSASKAGDMNKDGFDDIIIGAYGHTLNENQVGRAYVYFGGTPMDTIADMVMTGAHDEDAFGYNVSEAGDINKDGYSDILVSASYYKNPQWPDGRVNIYYGSTTPDTIADVIIIGRKGQSGGDINKDGYSDLLIDQSVYWGGRQMDSIPDFNFSDELRIAGAGDYNNDGYADIITGQPTDNTIGEGRGCVSIYYGSNQLHSNADVTFHGELARELFGRYVSGGGDLNQDGYDDFLIVAAGFEGGMPVPGTVSLYFGGPTLKSVPDFKFEGRNASFAGDMNGDGFSDMITGKSDGSQAFIYLGKNQFNGMPDLTINRENEERFRTMASAGDFNKDGYDDIIIGDQLNNTKGTQAGRAFLYFGGPTVDTRPDLTFNGEATFNQFGATAACAGDINNDGFSDIMIGAPLYDRQDLLGRIYIYLGSSSPDTIPDVVITGSRHYRKLGSVIAAAGDVNGDGYDDFMVGLPYEGNGIDTSYVYIYYGGATIDAIPDVIIKNRFEFGLNVASAGDLNFDGYDDIAVNSLHGIYIYYGGQYMDTESDIFIPSETVLGGIAGSSTFAGDVNKDGHSDILIGLPYSCAAGAAMGRAYIYSSQVINTGIPEVKDETQNQVFPNPFSTETTIQYRLRKPGKVVIKVFNTSGQEIKTLINAFQPSGEHTIKWHPGNLPDGIYFCRIHSPLGIETRKMILQN